jgi:homoserine dehydrogenase
MRVFVAGVGLVGSELVRQLTAVKPQGLSLIGLANSRKMLLGGEVSLDRLQTDGGDLNWDAVFACLSQEPSVFVDCTASEAVAWLYSRLLEAGVSVVTANKSLFSMPQAEFNKTRPYSHLFYYEAACGAGLPVISTLKDLLATGDQVLRIEGVFSGTLSYLFSQLLTKPYSQAVQDAKALGYTEPDPRDDLNGRDVMRKLVVLARTAGMQLDPDDVQVESLVSAEQQQMSVEGFMAQLTSQDAEFADKVAAATEADSVLQYVGCLDFASNSKTVGVKAIPRTSPIASLSPGCNIFAFTTARYERPLIVQGPGAGAVVTAAGVFSDILKTRRT